MKKINVGILAHVDAGKTTLTEQMLFKAGELRSFGSVDKGTTQTDSMEVERSRGISVKNASASLSFGQSRIHIIDTPGHADFISEVERALSVLDYGILVISAVEGLQAQTELLLSVAKDMGLPLFVFVNKIDRLGSQGMGCIKELKAAGYQCAALNLPENECGENPGLLPASPEELVLALEDEELLQRYFEGSLGEELWSAASLALSEGRIMPVLFGSSKLGIGVLELLKFIDLLAVEKIHQGPMCGRVFKLDRDPVLGKGAYVRLFSGIIKSRQSIYIPRIDEEEKCTAIRIISGRHSRDTDSLEAGDIAVLYGLSSICAGDIIGHGTVPGKAPSVARPLLSVKVQPQREEELSQLQKALAELSQEDPLLQLQWIPQKRELSLNIAGSIQIEILQILLEERYSLKVIISPPSVIYMETPKRAAEGFDAYTMPKPCWAVLRFAIEPLPRGSGLVYESKLTGGDLPYRYQNHVETAVPRALEQGLNGWQVTDLKVSLIFGEHHHVHTHPLDFFLCTPLAIMNGLQNAGTNLLEPYYRVRMSAAEKHLGKAIGMVLDRRGSFDSPIIENGRFLLVALIPVAEAMDLPESFAILTGGRGSMGYRFSHYDICLEDFTVQRERTGVNPLDRPKFILEQRSALQSR